MISLHKGEDMAKRVLSAPKVSKEARNSELRAILEQRRSLLLLDIQNRIRHNRSGSQKSELEKVDSENGEVPDIQEEIEFALIQMKAETLTKIDSALARLEEGRYGNCSDCGNPISEQRLRALPFAVRCRVCEDKIEINALHDLEKRPSRTKPSSRFFPPKGK